MDRATRMLDQLTVEPGTRAALDDRDRACKRRPAHRLDTASPVVAPTG